MRHRTGGTQRRCSPHAPLTARRPTPLGSSPRLIRQAEPHPSLPAPSTSHSTDQAAAPSPAHRNRTNWYPRTLRATPCSHKHGGRSRSPPPVSARGLLPSQPTPTAPRRHFVGWGPTGGAGRRSLLSRAAPQRHARPYPPRTAPFCPSPIAPAPQRTHAVPQRACAAPRPFWMLLRPERREGRSDKGSRYRRVSRLMSGRRRRTPPDRKGAAVAPLPLCSPPTLPSVPRDRRTQRARRPSPHCYFPFRRCVRMPLAARPAPSPAPRCRRLALPWRWSGYRKWAGLREAAELLLPPGGRLCGCLRVEGRAGFVGAPRSLLRALRGAGVGGRVEGCYSYRAPSDTPSYRDRS